MSLKREGSVAAAVAWRAVGPWRWLYTRRPKERTQSDDTAPSSATLCPTYPEASQATAALVLGILGFVCCFFLAPFAWWIGAVEVSAIDAGRRPPQNRGVGNAGKILGIIGTVLMAPLVLIFLFLNFATVMAALAGA